MSRDKVMERLIEMNLNSDFPLEESEIEEIVSKAKEDRKKKTIKKEEDNIIYISYYEDNDYILEQVSPSPRSPRSPRSSRSDLRIIAEGPSSCASTRMVR